jgi:glutamate-1-semialdehyde 2,1-aminomutase
VLPDEGYLDDVRRICTERDVVLIFDEVKCGATIAAGGATERFGVQPDLACFAKAIGGGTPTAAFGGKADIMAVIADGAAQQGTFNGNPLVAAAGLAALTEVLTPDAYEHMEKLGTRLADGCRDAIAAHGIPANVVDLGCKGCVSYRPEPLRNFRDFLETNATLFAASWAWVINRGIFMTPGDEEQWTISVQHTEDDIERYVDVFGEFCAALGD